MLMTLAGGMGTGAAAWLAVRWADRWCRRHDARVGSISRWSAVALAALTGAALVRLGGHAHPWNTAALAVIAVIGAGLACADLASRRVPNPAVAVLTALVVALLGAGQAAGEAGAGRALLAGLVCGTVVLPLALTGAIGMGDAKLAVPLGTALGRIGWGALFAGVYASVLLAVAFAVAAMMRQRTMRGVRVPFAPALVAGTLLTALLAGP